MTWTFSKGIHRFKGLELYQIEYGGHRVHEMVLEVIRSLLNTLNETVILQ